MLVSLKDNTVYLILSRKILIPENNVETHLGKQNEITRMCEINFIIRINITLTN